MKDENSHRAMHNTGRSAELDSVPADFIGQYGLGYTVAILASPQFAQALGPLVDSFAALPKVIWPMPAGTLHITVCELIECRPYLQDKAALAALSLPAWKEGIRRTLSATPPFSLRFSVVEASPQAIIARSEDTKVLNTVRQRLLTYIKLPTETKQPPPIVHTTIARYLAAVPLHQIRQLLRSPFDHTEAVTEFVLLKTTIRPLLAYEVIERFPLYS